MKIVANHHEISFQQLPSLYLVEIPKIFSSIPCPVLIKFQLRVLLFAENLHGRQHFLPHVKLSRHGDRRRRRSSPPWYSKSQKHARREHIFSVASRRRRSDGVVLAGKPFIIAQLINFLKRERIFYLKVSPRVASSSSSSWRCWRRSSGCQQSTNESWYTALLKTRG